MLDVTSNVVRDGIIVRDGLITKAGERFREAMLDKTEYAPLSVKKKSRIREYEGQNDTRIQLGSLEHEIDWQSAKVRTTPGKLVVEMLPAQDQRGGILLPANAAGNCRSDIGVVLASPAPVTVKGKRIEPPQPGETVCVMPYGGTWIEGAEMGDYCPANQVRVYGAYKPYDEAFLVDWWECVVCSISESGGDYVLKPYGDKILLRLDPVVSTDGGIILADSAQYRTGKATVVDAGPLEFDCKPGDKVTVNLDMLEQVGLTFDLAKDVDLAICNHVAICWIEEMAA